MPIPEQFAPNSKLRLQQPCREVARFKHLYLRTEHTYWDWIRRYILFHRKRHPRDMGAAEAQSSLTRRIGGKRKPQRRLKVVQPGSFNRACSTTASFDAPRTGAHTDGYAKDADGLPLPAQAGGGGGGGWGGVGGSGCVVRENVGVEDSA